MSPQAKNAEFDGSVIDPGGRTAPFSWKSISAIWQAGLPQLRELLSAAAVFP